MEKREQYKQAYRVAREALRESAKHRDGCFSIVRVGVVGVDVLRQRCEDAPLLRCYGEMGEAIAVTMVGRNVTSFACGKSPEREAGRVVDPRKGARQVGREREGPILR